MEPAARVSALAPFRVASFRFQWPADLLTSWAFEMETLILGWYVLVETGSVFWLTVFGSLQFLGTLIAPAFGLASDRLGRRATLCAMRAVYVVLAAAIMALALAELLTPAHVFAIAILAGLVRPSDLVLRNALIGDTIPASALMSAMAVSRTAMDSARIAGALAGAGLFAQLGLGPAYAVVAAFYLASLVLTLGVSRRPPADGEPAAPPGSVWRELARGMGYVWATPTVLAIMWLAFLVNLTAYPVTQGLLPYVAREIYAVDEAGLGRLVAAYAAGALAGSLVMVFAGGWRQPGRVMLVGIWSWYLLLAGFGLAGSMLPGFCLLLGIGFAQSLGMVAMSVALLSITATAYRGRVMGVRMLAVYGLPLGLLASSWLIAWLGFPAAVALYCAVGLAVSGLIAGKWRLAIWHAQAGLPPR